MDNTATLNEEYKELEECIDSNSSSEAVESRTSKKSEVVTFTMKDLIETDNFTLNLPDISSDKTYVPQNGSPYMLVDASPICRYSAGCPHCGSATYLSKGNLNGSNGRIIHDVNVGLSRVDIRLQVPRYTCSDCGKSFNYRFESINEKRAMTNRLIAQIRAECFTQNFSRIAQSHGISIETVRNIFADYADELEQARGVVKAPPRIGIDEKHIQHEARLVVVNDDTGELLEMKKKNTEQYFVEAIESLEGYENIKVITTDMAGSYSSYIKKHFPYAIQVIDRFHVMQDVGHSIVVTRETVLTYIRAQLLLMKNNPEAKLEYATKQELIYLLGLNPYLYKFGKDQLSKPANTGRSSRTQITRMELLTALDNGFPELKHLHQLRRILETMYDRCTDRMTADKMFDFWLSLIPPQIKYKNGQQTTASIKKRAAWEAKFKLKPELYDNMCSCGNGLNSHKAEILNYFEPGCKVTNAAAEGLNNFVGAVDRKGNGYTFETLRALALYYHIADQGITYKFSSERIPVYEPSLGMFNEHFTFGQYGNSSKPSSYITLHEIVEEKTPHKERLPILLAYKNLPPDLDSCDIIE